MRRLVRSLAILIVLYVVAYVVFRQLSIEVWAKDQRAYVIFPEKAAWTFYLFRPLTYVDAALTGMRFHIGPHR
jgi:hypothetical protein